MDNGTSSTEDNDLLGKNFLYNDMLSRALVQLFPKQERSHIDMWLERLQAITGDRRQLMTRNDYAWLLLLALRSGTLVEPFDRNPPSDDLPPIEEVMPAHVFEEMLSSGEQHFSWVDKLLAETSVADDKGSSESNGIPPYKFLSHQPQPVNGVSCYFSVFSKQSQN